jgi:Ca2+-binding EF-hand superfamily protein
MLSQRLEYRLARYLQQLAQCEHRVAVATALLVDEVDGIESSTAAEMFHLLDLSHAGSVSASNIKTFLNLHDVSCTMNDAQIILRRYSRGSSTHMFLEDLIEKLYRTSSTYVREHSKNALPRRRPTVAVSSNNSGVGMSEWLVIHLLQVELEGERLMIVLRDGLKTEYPSFYDMFRSLDISNRGRITSTDIHEFTAAHNLYIPSPEMESLFCKLDHNRDGCIHYMDFLEEMTPFEIDPSETFVANVLTDSLHFRSPSLDSEKKVSFDSPIFKREIAADPKERKRQQSVMKEVSMHDPTYKLLSDVETSPTIASSIGKEHGGLAKILLKKLNAIKEEESIKERLALLPTFHLHDAFVALSNDLVGAMTVSSLQLFGNLHNVHYSVQEATQIIEMFHPSQGLAVSYYEFCELLMPRDEAFQNLICSPHKKRDNTLGMEYKVAHNFAIALRQFHEIELEWQDFRRQVIVNKGFNYYQALSQIDIHGRGRVNADSIREFLTREGIDTSANDVLWLYSTIDPSNAPSLSYSSFLTALLPSN